MEQDDRNKIKRYWRSSAFTKGAFASGRSSPHPTFYVKKSLYQQYGLFSLAYDLGNDIEISSRFLEKYENRSLVCTATLGKKLPGWRVEPVK